LRPKLLQIPRQHRSGISLQRIPCYANQAIRSRLVCRLRVRCRDRPDEIDAAVSREAQAARASAPRATTRSAGSVWRGCGQCPGHVRAGLSRESVPDGGTLRNALGRCAFRPVIHPSGWTQSCCRVSFSYRVGGRSGPRRSGEVADVPAEPHLRRVWPGTQVVADTICWRKASCHGTADQRRSAKRWPDT